MSPLSAARTHSTRATSSVELPECFAQATSASYARILAKRVSRRTAAERKDARRLARIEARIASVETPEPRVTCPVCNGAATCMLCDDNGLVPTSSLTVDQRRANDRHVCKSRVLGGAR